MPLETTTPARSSPPLPDDIDGEADLVERAQRHAGAFAQLYDRYVVAVYRFAYRRTGSHQDAEDITGQTFFRALDKLPSYEWRGVPFGAWLFRIAANLVADHHRARTTHLSLDGMLDAGAHPPEGHGSSLDDSLADRDDLHAAWQAVALLPPLQRRAVTLRFGHELSHAEVGVRIGRSEAATKQLIYRAMLTLRHKMEGTR